MIRETIQYSSQSESWLLWTMVCSELIDLWKQAKLQ
jgi:hypothetical protein